MAFDLEKAIAAWRRPYEVHPAFCDDDVDELESSLRDRTQALIDTGLSEEEAFRTAVRRVGSLGAAEAEYLKVFWGKAKRQRRLGDEILWRMSMLRNYLLISLRTLRRQKGYSIINVVGLAIGIAASVLILLFVRHETSFDKHHENVDTIFRLGIDSKVGDGILRTVLTQAPFARTLIAEFPEVVNAARFFDGGRVLVEQGDVRFDEDGLLWADSTVFDLFTIPLVEGDPATALTQPHTLVLTEEMARKYFGDASPIGRTLRIDKSDEYEVTGVMRTPKSRSHLDFDFLASLATLPDAESDAWLTIRYHTYLLLREPSDAAKVFAKLPDFDRKHIAPQAAAALGPNHADGLVSEYFLENLGDVYLHSDADHQIGRTGNIQYVYIMSAIAFLVLLVACINFTNLSTAASERRAKEVGVRKVMGSKRSRLILQFLVESMVMAFLALIIACALVLLTLPAFRSVTGVELSFSGMLVLGMIGITVITGLLAGIYPALVLSAFSPATMLKGTFGGRRRSWMRSSLVVTQFAVSIALLVGTAVVWKQLQYIQDKELGFDKDHVVVLSLETRAAAERFDAFRSTLLQNPDILEVAASSVLPGPSHQGRRGFRKEGASGEDLFVADWGEVSPEYIETLELEIVAGRSFSRAHGTDVDGFLLNESAARMMGWEPETAIGERLQTVREPDRVGPVVGVFRDAHFGSLHEVVEPLIFGGRFATDVHYLPVRIREGRISHALPYLEEQWASFEPAQLFNYFFLDEDYGRFYEQERRLGDIYGGFTGLSIFIACLGLFGLASFVTQRRTKEIGVRKVLGASAGRIVVLLSAEFTLLVVVAAAAAFPISYYAMMLWLQNFAYAVAIGPDVYALAGIVALATAWMTVGFHTIKAARTNPVHALRYE